MNPDSHLILQSTPLFNALEKLSSIDDGVMTLLAADADGRLTGTLTDGDIRRALLRGVSLQTRVADVMNSSFRRISASDPAATESGFCRLSMPTAVSHGFSICSRQRRFCRCRQSSWPEAAANASDH